MSNNVSIRLLLLALLCVAPIACGNGCTIDTAGIGGPVDSNGGSDSPSDDAPTTTHVDGIPDDDDLADPGDPVAKLSYMAGWKNPKVQPTNSTSMTRPLGCGPCRSTEQSFPLPSTVRSWRPVGA